MTNSIGGAIYKGGLFFICVESSNLRGGGPPLIYRHDAGIPVGDGRAAAATKPHETPI